MNKLLLICFCFFLSAKSKVQSQVELSGIINTNLNLSLYISSNFFAKEKIIIENNKFKWYENVLSPNSVLFIEISNNTSKHKVVVEILVNPSSNINLSINNFDSIRYGKGFTFFGLPYQSETEIFNSDIIPLEQEYYFSLTKIKEAKLKRKKGNINLDSLADIAQSKKKDYLNESLKFILINKTSYFSLYKFNHIILKPANIKNNTPEQLEYFLNSFDSVIKKTKLWNESRLIIEKWNGLLVGRKAPDFTFLDISKKNHSLYDLLKEKKVLIYFTASWCFPCRKINPFIKKISEKYDLYIISISIDEDQAAWLKYVKENKFATLLTCDLPEYTFSTSVKALYNVNFIPRINLVDKSQTIIYTNEINETARFDTLNKILEETESKIK